MIHFLMNQALGEDGIVASPPTIVSSFKTSPFKKSISDQHDEERDGDQEK